MLTPTDLLLIWDNAPMQTIKQLCIPRPSVFDAQRRDTVLEISDLIGKKIKREEFFEENYITEGMWTLLEQTTSLSRDGTTIRSLVFNTALSSL
jgi:hypothetical protein